MRDHALRGGGQGKTHDVNLWLLHMYMCASELTYTYMSASTHLSFETGLNITEAGLMTVLPQPLERWITAAYYHTWYALLLAIAVCLSATKCELYNI